MNKKELREVIFEEGNKEKFFKMTKQFFYKLFIIDGQYGGLEFYPLYKKFNGKIRFLALKYEEESYIIGRVEFNVIGLFAIPVEYLRSY